jgi:hypothetical protein
MRVRIRLGLATAALAVATAGTLTSFGAPVAASASPGTSCAPSVPCLITQLTCTNKFCHG